MTFENDTPVPEGATPGTSALPEGMTRAQWRLMVAAAAAREAQHGDMVASAASTADDAGDQARADAPEKKTVATARARATAVTATVPRPRRAAARAHA